jgi:L-amino acid N-acyltransferase YncA
VTAAQDLVIRHARLEDLPRLTEIYNYYVVNTPITFHMEPFSVVADQVNLPPGPPF